MRLSRRPGRRGRERIYLLGVAGHPNFGDDAITRGWLRWLARRRPDAQVWLDTPNPSGAAALHHGVHHDIVFVDTIHRLAREVEGTMAERCEHVDGVLEEPGRSARWVAGIEAFHAAGRVHLLGGGYLTGQAPEFAPLVTAARWARQHRDATVGATGLGLMPASDELAALWHSAADAFTVLTVRDAASAAVVGPRASVAPDDIFLGGVAQHVVQRPDLPRTVVLVQDDAHDRFDDVERLVRQTLDAWDADDVLFVEANPPVDHRIVAALRDRYPSAPFVPFRDVMRDGLPVAPNQRWITTRYHPHLLAAASGASGVAISVSDDYYGVKHAAVQTMGSGWTLVGAGDDPVEPGPPGELPARAAHHTADLEGVARALYG